MTEPTNKPQSPPRPAPRASGTGDEARHRTLPSHPQLNSREMVTAPPPSRDFSTAPPEDADPETPFVPTVPPPEAPVDPYIGATIDGRYKVEGRLGEGGMGVVYKARHRVIDKAVAIKVLRADLARDAEITERFLREARAASAIGNPHIIDISDFGTLPDGSTYFVMEFLDGQPLSALLDQREPMGLSLLIDISMQIANGLDSAHQRQIVHRDLKPDNVFIIDRGSEKNFVKILDFGIAKVSSGTAKLTRHGSVFGTPHYMSPEQAAGAPVDHRTDIYSLGVIMYEMASGKLPFDADNFMGILTQHMYQAPVPIRALVPPQDIPPGLEAIVMKCLSKKPEQRYQSMLELVEDLGKVTKGLVPDAVGEMMGRSGGFNVPADFFKSSMPVPVPATPPSMLQRKPWPLYAGVAGVIAAVAIVVGIFAFGQYSTAASHPGSEPSVGLASPPVSQPIVAPAQPTATVKVEARKVLVVTTPNDVEIFDGDKKLGPAPLLVEVPEGKPLVLTARLTGYEDYAFQVDGSKDRERVDLKASARPGVGKPKPPVAGEVPAPPPATKPPPTVPKPPATKPPPPSVGGGEIVNPWGN